MHDLLNGQPRLDLKSRQTEILDRVQKYGFVSIEQLAKLFSVSEQTVRRDIKQLEKQRLVIRYHGGAGLTESHLRSDTGYDSRKEQFAAEKRRIAELVAERIPDGASIFIDIGTTMEAVAKALLVRKRLTVLTNHVSVATILSESTEFEIILAGGILRHRDHATTGAATREFLERFRVGYGIFGIGGINDDGELLDFDFRDVSVSVTALQISRKKFIALDHSKFETDAIVHVGHVSDVDAIFSDTPPPERLRRLLREHGVESVTPELAGLPRSGGRDSDAFVSDQGSGGA